MNDYLKELGELAEINEPACETYYKGMNADEATPKYALLSTHAGRRTFHLQCAGPRNPCTSGYEMDGTQRLQSHEALTLT